jgi:hypothetical protein
MTRVSELDQFFPRFTNLMKRHASLRLTSNRTVRLPPFKSKLSCFRSISTHASPSTDVSTHHDFRFWLPGLPFHRERIA